LPVSPSSREPQGHARDRACRLGFRQFNSARRCFLADGSARRVRVRRSNGSGHGAPPRRTLTMAELNRRGMAAARPRRPPRQHDLSSHVPVSTLRPHRPAGPTALS
jgi:hypothetical protein